MTFDENEDVTFENEKIFIEFFINAFLDAFSSLDSIEKKTDEEKKTQIRVICKHFRKQARANKKAKRQVKKIKSRVIKRAMKETIKKVFMSKIPVSQASSVSCLPDSTPTLTPSEALIEASILADADENDIVDKVKNTAVETAENIVALSTSYFVLPSLSIIGESMDIDFNIMKIDCCVKESASSCFFVFLTSSVIDIDVSMNPNLNIITDDYCVRKPISSCFFVILTPLVTDITFSSELVESVISALNIMRLDFAASSLYYFFFNDMLLA